MTVGKIKSLTENKIRNSLFFTNTKLCMEFTKFSLLNFFFPKNVMSERRLLYTHQCHWLGFRGGGRKTPTGTILNTLLFPLKCCRLCHPSHIEWREGLKIDFPAPQSLTLLHWFEMCIDFGALGTQIWKYCKSNYKWDCSRVALHDTVFLPNICILHLAFAFHI